jgi:hypothetical protein
VAEPSVPSPEEPRRVAGGFTVPEYERRVWDMARHLLHPSALYVVGVVGGATRLLAHEVVERPGTGAVVQVGLFACAFLGAWACFYSTLLRDAGLPSRTVTVLAPLAVVVALVVWTVLPAPPRMSPALFWSACAALGVPGPLAFVATLRQWRRLRREHAHLLPEQDR